MRILVSSYTPFPHHQSPPPITFLMLKDFDFKSSGSADPRHLPPPARLTAGRPILMKPTCDSHQAAGAGTLSYLRGQVYRKEGGARGSPCSVLIFAALLLISLLFIVTYATGMDGVTVPASIVNTASSITAIFHMRFCFYFCYFCDLNLN